MPVDAIPYKENVLPVTKDVETGFKVISVIAAVDVNMPAIKPIIEAVSLLSPTVFDVITLGIEPV